MINDARRTTHDARCMFHLLCARGSMYQEAHLSRGSRHLTGRFAFPVGIQQFEILEARDEMRRWTEVTLQSCATTYRVE